MESKGIRYYKDQLSKKTISFVDLPEKLQANKTLIRTARAAGLRIIEHRGYDIIRKVFFVEELFVDVEDEKRDFSEESIFLHFDDYYMFLEGDIYHNAVYYGYAFNDSEIEQYNLDTDLLYSRTHFVDETVDDYTADMIIAEKKSLLKQAAAKKRTFRNWVNEINKCCTATELSKLYKRVLKVHDEEYAKYLTDFFISNNSNKAFDLLMSLINSGQYTPISLVGMCVYYGGRRVHDAYNYNPSNLSKKALNKHKKTDESMFQMILDKRIKIRERKGYNSEMGLYCVRLVPTNPKGEMTFSERHACVIRCFWEFDDFAYFLHGKLDQCDLSEAPISLCDILIYGIGSDTKLPISYNGLHKDIVKKAENNNYTAVIRWKNNEDRIVSVIKKQFTHLFDFVYFLKGDLSGCDFLKSEGIECLKDFPGINLNNIRAKSYVLDQLGITYDKPEYLIQINDVNETVLANEYETLPVLQINRKPLSFEEEFEYNKISYVTDIHIENRIQNNNCKSTDDISVLIDEIAASLIEASGDMLLIGGDVCHTKELFISFINALSLHNMYKIPIVFVLGNHELWPYTGCTVSEICESYQSILEDHDMYYIQNSILYSDIKHELASITYEQLQLLDTATLREIFRSASLIIYGGIGFSGCEDKYNANAGIYRGIIDRNQEVKESTTFFEQYQKVCAAAFDKNVIIFTHMPLSNWSNDGKYQEGFFYVSGHTHKNAFLNDGAYHIYADNQIGYNGKTVNKKFFYIDKTFDYFLDYADGIYEINREEYLWFNRGNGIGITYNRDGQIIMLKKNGYYCFLRRSPKGTLSMMNGGALVNLTYNDPNYYYENMDRVIASIKKPMEPYTELQNAIASAVKSFGGEGRIHGCIVDIDFYNHIFVNPFDHKLTPYFARDMVQKYIYDDVASLLEEKCPELYLKYKKQITGKSPFLPVLSNTGYVSTKANNESTLYLSTDIYQASRQIKKMQKLDKKILSIWHESTKKQIPHK